MGVAAILVMGPSWSCDPDPRTTFVLPTHGGSTWNLVSIGPAVLEKMFKNGGRRRTDDGACLYCKLTYEPKGSGELKSGFLLYIK